MRRLTLILLILLAIKANSSSHQQDNVSYRSSNTLNVRLLASKNKQEENSSEDSHRLTAHPYYNKAQEQVEEEKAQKLRRIESVTKNTKQKDKQQKEQPDKENNKQLEGQWHFYFTSMIIATLAGMKILSIQEQRVHHTNRQFERTPISTSEEKQHSDQRSFTAQH